MIKQALIYKIFNRTSEKKNSSVDDWMGDGETNETDYENLKLLREDENYYQIPDSDRTAGFQKIRQLVRSRRKNRRRRQCIAAILSTLVVTSAFLGYQLLRHDRPHKATYKFEAVSLAAIIEVLQKDYQVNITVSHEELLSCPFTGTFTNCEPEQMVFGLANALGLQSYKISAVKFNIAGRGCIATNESSSFLY
jgi:ferric-dicitrate binding protein FerR (iron transport regulator)